MATYGINYSHLIEPIKLFTHFAFLPHSRLQLVPLRSLLSPESASQLSDLPLARMRQLVGVHNVNSLKATKIRTEQG